MKPSEYGRKLTIVDISVTPSTKAHSCCKRTEQRKTILSYLAAAIAAFLACLCCSLPLIPLMLGLSAGSSFLTLTKHHLVFDILGGVILLGSLLYIWHEHNASDKSAFKKPQFWTCLVITFTMYTAMSFVIKHIVLPKVAGASEYSIHEHH